MPKKTMEKRSIKYEPAALAWKKLSCMHDLAKASDRVLEKRMPFTNSLIAEN